MADRWEEKPKMGSYFTRREPTHPPDYEESYWGVIRDPDGNDRDRLRERDKHLEDIKGELAFLGGLPPGKILDVGCGLGYLLSALSPRWERYGIEVSRFAGGYASQWGRIHLGSLESANYPAETFDVVVMHHVIEHIEDPCGSIREVHRILKPGGILLLGTPDFDSGCARRFGENYRLLHDPTHVSLFTSDSMHRFLRDNGFVIDRVEYPFFETRYFTPENLMRLFDTSRISPPFYGNFMTFYCHKPRRTSVYAALLDLSGLAMRMAETLEPSILAAADLMSSRLVERGKVLAYGDGGSAADARHFVADLVERMGTEKETVAHVGEFADAIGPEAAGNEQGYAQTFTRSTQGLGQPGDVLLAISTSGHSPKILRLLESARGAGVRTVALVGPDGDPSLGACDVCLRVESDNAQRVQELHRAVLHVLGDRIEEGVSGFRGKPAATKG